MPRYDMVDLSNNNGLVPTSAFRSMKAKGVKAVISKITEGVYYRDSCAKTNLARARSVGLQIHGYHFARFTTVGGAKSEAAFACKVAKDYGLPAGHVMVCDFESYNRGWNQNNATTKAFKQVVQSYGYRYDLYTMGSWLNSVSINNSGRAGWIANYPYDPSGKKYYGSYNSWQWTSGAHFNGSGSRFDVSCNYSDFYTKGAVALKPKHTGEYYDYNPIWAFPKYPVGAYRKLEECSTHKNVVKTYKAKDKLHIKALVKSPYNPKVTRFELTNGTYITASKDYINNLYFMPSEHRVTRVKSAHGTAKYKRFDFDDKYKVASFRAGTLFDVAKVVRSKSGISRLKLADGTYISGNKLVNGFVKGN